ncbi:MAG: protoporphyrinogen oxidase [Propionibacteriales bacterium]|nr:protoporphyrinogen oxidase [Propionibacteriales bacterium]
MHVGVVGGGIAGVTAALALGRELPGCRVTVLEGGSRIGGKLSVSEVAGVPVDEGAEALLNRRPEAVALTREAGLGADLVHPETTSSAIWTRGGVRPLPPTLMGVPTDLAALARSGIVSRTGLVRARLDRVLPRSPVRGDAAVGSVVGRRLGREVRDRLLEPLLGGVYAGHAAELSLRAGVPQLSALADADRSLLSAAADAAARSDRAAEGPVFAGICGGVGRLPEAVARASSAEIRMGAMVRRLERRTDGWRLVVGPTRDEEVLDVDAVVIAVPAAPAARLLKPHAAIAAEHLEAIGYASVAVVTFAFARRAVGDRLAGSGFLVPPVDGRSVKAATYSTNKWAWMADADPDVVIVRTSLGRYAEERDLQRDDVDLAAVALEDLRAATGIMNPPIDTRVTRWGGGLPQYHVGHGDRVAAIRSDVAGLPGVAVCGAAYDGLGIAACVASAHAAATRVAGWLGAPGRIGA